MDYNRLVPEHNNDDSVFELCLTCHFAYVLEMVEEKASADAQTLSLLREIAKMRPQVAPNGHYKGKTTSGSPPRLLDVQRFLGRLHVVIFYVHVTAVGHRLVGFFYVREPTGYYARS